MGQSVQGSVNRTNLTLLPNNHNWVNNVKKYLIWTLVLNNVPSKYIFYFSEYLPVQEWLPDRSGQTSFLMK